MSQVCVWGGEQVRGPRVSGHKFGSNVCPCGFIIEEGTCLGCGDPAGKKL